MPDRLWEDGSYEISVEHAILARSFSPVWLPLDGVEINLTQRAADSAERDKTLEDGLQIFASTSPQKRLIQLEEVADLIVILASISAKGIMGQPINVDGGAVMI